MIALIVTVALAALISALCSTTEAMLYSVPWTHIEKLKEENRPVGKLLFELRSKIDKPISAVLTLNTVANTAGSAVAGALASAALGPENLIWFTMGFTVLILIVGEILPKTFGVVYANQLSIILAYPLKGLIYIFTPFIIFSSLITGLITKNKGTPEATDDDIRIMAKMSAEAGGIEDFEEKVITNILALDKKYIHEIMTPRTMVFSLPADMTIQEALKQERLSQFTRIPLYKSNNEDIVGLITQKELSKYLRKTFLGEEIDLNTPLENLMTPIAFIPESQTIDKALLSFLESRQHLAAVFDEYGGLAGVTTLEDVIEEMLGREIVDESDVVADLRESAKALPKALRSLNLQQAESINTSESNTTDKG